MGNRGDEPETLILPAVLVVAATAVATVQLWPSTLKDLRASNLCQSEVQLPASCAGPIGAHARYSPSLWKSPQASWSRRTGTQQP
ncbi:hypothetical protein NKH18_05935 [Streptomyces sp. M10(2022)]